MLAPDRSAAPARERQLHDISTSLRSSKRLLRGFAVPAVVVLGVVARVGTLDVSPLWLDEAQSVSIAETSLSSLPDALAGDGAPPLYYVLLHAWTTVLGTSAVAARALSLVIALATLPVAWWAGRSFGGTRAASYALVLFATSPFAVRYATEARMYALVLLLSTVVVTLALAEPLRTTARRAGVLALASAALAYTHYWGVLLVVAVAGVVGVRAARGEPPLRRSARRRCAALLIAVIALLPWAPILLRQVASTGAPWGRPPGADIALSSVRGFMAGDTLPGALLALGTLLVLGALLPRGPSRHASAVRALSASAALVLVLGGFVLHVTGEGFAPRHAAPALPALLLAVAVGVPGFAASARAKHVLVAGASVLALVAAVLVAFEPRTQIGTVAAVLRANSEAGDVIVVCPDQLAPSLARLVDRPLLTVPPSLTSSRVDWTDYRERVDRIDARAVAVRALAAARSGRVWLVWSPNYVEVGSSCRRLKAAFTELRPGGTSVVRLDRHIHENAELWAVG